MDIDRSHLHLVYVNQLGMNVSGVYTYEFIFSDEPDECWGYGWETKPVCNVLNPRPEDKFIDTIFILQTEVKFDCGQDNCCYTYQDCKDRVYSIASENLDELTEYPDYRLILYYGDSYNDVCTNLSKKDLFFDYDKTWKKRI